MRVEGDTQVQSQLFLITVTPFNQGKLSIFRVLTGHT